MNAPRTRPAVDADLAEALAATTHLDIRHFRRANETAVLDAEQVYAFSPMFIPRHAGDCACDDCLDALIRVVSL